MNPINMFSLVIVLFCCNYTLGKVTFLDETFKPLYRLYRNSMIRLIGRSDGSLSYEWNLKRGKVQKPIPESQPLFCDVNGPGKRSSSVPKSVHQLRPGDIDIIAALGDSLTAGNGALATNVFQLNIENKGVSGTIGGQSTWRKYLTLPNIIKEYNPNLYGYSLSDSYSTDRNSRFNIAEMGGMSQDIPNEALVLIKRMTADPHMISILIGPNDFCSNFCLTDNPEKTVDHHEKDLVRALRILRDNLPGTMVNLITPPNIKLLTELRGNGKPEECESIHHVECPCLFGFRYRSGKPEECESIHHVECPCLFGFRYRSNRERYFKLMERWQDVSAKVCGMKEFNKQDFIVVNQPFLRNITYPTLSNGKHDFTYLSLDCFHLSQKGYALAINAMWNNMFEPEGQKSTNWKKEFTEFLCPTPEQPYITTRMNS